MILLLSLRRQESVSFFMADFANPGTYSYNGAGSNTPVQVTANPTVLYQVSVSQTGGSAGFLQLYNNGTFDVGAGTPDFVIPLNSGTSGAGTPAFRDVVFGPYGRQMSAGLSYLWAAGATGTVAHGVNAVVDIGYRGTLV